MTSVIISTDDIPPLVRDLGLLAGLLVAQDDEIAFDFDWFANPLSELEAIPSRRAQLLALLRELLGERVAQAPPQQSWYALPWSGAPTPIHVVLPDGDDDSNATVGVGILDFSTHGKASVLAAAYAPLFALPIGNPIVVTGRAGHPIVLSLAVTLERTLTVAGTSFDGIELSCDLYVQDSAPDFALTFTLAGSPVGSVIRTLDVLRQRSATDWIDALLGVDSVRAWLDRPIGSSTVSIGDALVAAGLINRQGKAYVFATFDGLVGKTPAQIAELLLAAVLKALASNQKPILPLGDGGIWVAAASGSDGTDYGLRLQVVDAAAASVGSAKILLQLGKLPAGDTADSSWMSRSDPKGTFAAAGLSLTLLHESNGSSPTPSFRSRLDLVNVGIDIVGSGGQPLASAAGVTLGGLQPRFFVSFDLAHPDQVAWGVALRADDLGIPLGNGLSKANANPVAQNLLSSGGAKGGGDKQAVNPTFSASIGRLFYPDRTAALDVQLHSDGGSARKIWLPMQRSFGPLQCRRIGVEWPDDNPDLVLDFLFDGGVKLAALAVDLQGLSLGIPLAAPGQIEKYRLDLQGMGIACPSGPLSITAGFLKKTDATPVEYDGAAIIKAADWAIAAVGSYASLDGDPSLFIFARLSAELGGPPFFFVTGVCAGFGYNRSLRIPTQSEVPDFPLLSGIADPGKIGGADATPAQALAALDAWIAPARGIDWVAAGLQFTSFELVQSNAVITAVLTEDFQAAILGVSRMKLAQTGPQFAYVELGLSAVVDPAAGYLGISAQLSSNSYVLTQDCHLTGGFAFWIWYGGQHAGDFVITLGGYHPAFPKPSHYPDEPRLGFSWNVDSHVTIQGGAYFALTPSCAMGGGSLDVQFHDGDLHAWFTAYADFLFSWKPFYFIGDVGVSIGASYKLDLLVTSVTVSVEIGADLDIWGPPTGGRVHISWYIISFSVGFGADEQSGGGILPWSDFTTLLPQPAQQKQPQRRLARAAADDGIPQEVVTIALSDGLVRVDDGDWLVRGDTMCFSVASAFPSTSAQLVGATATSFAPAAPNDTLAVRPMGIAAITSVLTITVADKDNKALDLGGTWTWSASLQGVPAAMWGAPIPAGQHPPPGADTLPGRLVGIAALTPRTAAPTGPGPIPLTALGYAPLDQNDSDYLPLAPGTAPVARQPQRDPTSPRIIAGSIASTSVAARGAIFAALAALGFDAGTDGALDALAALASRDYPDPPMLGAPWQEPA